MTRNKKFERKIRGELQSDLSAGTPDVWAGIEERTRGPARREADGPEKRSAKGRRWLLRGAASLAAVAFLAACFSFLAYRLPLIQAKAETVYDSGGRLSSVASPAPSAGFVDSCNGFGLSILNRLGKEEKNVFLSPASIYLALGMTYNGAEGQTAADFEKTLHSSGGLAGFNKDCLALQSLIAGSSRFRLADSIWLTSPFRGEISDDFLNRDKSFFGSTICTLDFSSSAAPGVINGWVKKNTGDRIDPRFEKFDPDTVMVLINTIYFKSDWKQQFTSSDTWDGTFQTPAGAKTVKFMHGEYAHYFENGDLQGILLPYDDDQSSMMILLPKTGLADLLGKLTASDLAAYVKDNIGGKAVAELSLPRVNLSYRTSLNDTLKAMGMKSAFDPEQADFSGMLKPDSGFSLYISEVKHMTYLAIDEKGTEAAAATSVEMAATSAPLSQNVMNVNRPFLTAIVNNQTGAVLFLGAVTDPSVSQ